MGKIRITVMENGLFRTIWSKEQTLDFSSKENDPDRILLDNSGNAFFLKTFRENKVWKTHIYQYSGANDHWQIYELQPDDITLRHEDMRFFSQGNDVIFAALTNMSGSRRPYIYCCRIDALSHTIAYENHTSLEDQNYKNNEYDIRLKGFEPLSDGSLLAITELDIAVKQMPAPRHSPSCHTITAVEFIRIVNFSRDGEKKWVRTVDKAMQSARCRQQDAAVELLYL